MTNYRIKTEHGYLFTTAYGRYGGVHGKQSEGDVICEHHKDLAERTMKGLGLDYEVEDAPLSMPCKACKEGW